MSSSHAIVVEGISKQYRLGSIGTGTLTHDLNRWWHKIRGKEDPYLKLGVENDRTISDGSYVWALQDISFKIESGQVYRLIDRNGAGKSTMLKILSRITSPSRGTIKVKGRMASLLEVGTGFHPELTGRENIFLNGAILGMTRSEIALKMDAIIEFAGVSKYADTPIKRYSSGMLVRLGFAVAAHLSSDVLIVDEVLAVGDAEFQEKCIGKMKDISGEGRTVLFVSHNMASIKSLCKRGLLFDKGKLALDSNIDEVIEGYLAQNRRVNSNGIIPQGLSTLSDGLARFNKFSLRQANDRNGNSICYKEAIRFLLEVESKEELKDVILDLRIASREGIQVAHAMNRYGVQQLSLDSGVNKFECVMNNPFLPGKYEITIGLHHGNGLTIDYIENVFELIVLNIGVGNQPGYVFEWKSGYVVVDSTWKKL